MSASHTLETARYRDQGGKIISRTGRISSRGKMKSAFPTLVMLFVLVSSSVFPNVNVHATPIVEGYDCWTDRPEYHLSESVTIHVSIASVRCMCNYQLITYKPDGTRGTEELGQLLPARTYAFTGEAGPPTGERRVELWRNGNTLVAYTSFNVIGQGVETKFTGTAIKSVTGGIPGSPGGWEVAVDSVIFGPQLQGRVVSVLMRAVWPSGHIDPAIKAGDTVEAYGIYYSTGDLVPSDFVSLEGSENYYLVRLDRSPRIDSVKMNRNPVITTFKGFSLSAPPLETVAKMNKLGVWAALAISNPRADSLDGRLSVFGLDPVGAKQVLGRYYLHVDEGSSKTYYVPISGDWIAGTWRITFALEESTGWFSWKTLDEKSVQLQLTSDTPIKGPAHLGISKPIGEFLSAPEPSLSEIAIATLDLFLLLAQAWGSAYVTPEGPVFREPGSIKDLMPGTSGTEDPSVISAALARSASLKVSSSKTGRDTFTVYLETSCIQVEVAVGGSSYAFSPYYDRVRIVAKLPMGASVTNRGDAIEVLNDDSGNTYIMWVDNYADKLFSAGSRKQHRMNVKLEQGVEALLVEAYAYFEVGPLAKEPKAGEFPVTDYAKWNRDPSSVYWIEFTSKVAKTTLKVSAPSATTIQSTAEGQILSTLDSYFSNTPSQYTGNRVPTIEDIFRLLDEYFEEE